MCAGHAPTVPPCSLYGARISGAPQQPGIILLRDGTDTSQGKPQLISNINACAVVADVIRTTLGPRGMDKLIYSDREVRDHWRRAAP